MLLAIPAGVLDEEAFPVHSADEEHMVGPAKTLHDIALFEEEETPSGALQVIRTGVTCSVVVCDFLDSVLAYLHEYDPVTDVSLDLVPFEIGRPGAIPLHSELVAPALEWARGELESRVLFYSAREEQEEAPPPIATPKRAAAKRVTTAFLAEQVSEISAQMAVLMKQHATAEAGQYPKTLGQPSRPVGHAAEPKISSPGFRMPALSNRLNPPSPPLPGQRTRLIGPPPKVKAIQANTPMPPEEPYNLFEDAAGQDPALAALTQQSAALTALVAHLVSQDGNLDLSNISGATSSSTKGTLKREKLQQDLAARKSSFFLQIQQQIFKKLHPSKVMPKSEEELAQSQVSFQTYLERYGGYKGQREAGLCMWILSHAMDAAAVGDFSATKEFLALGVMALEQSVFDAGDWSLAYVLALVEDPPSNLFSERMNTLSAAGRPFSPLVPPGLASTNLGYIKELEVLSTRRTETRAKKPQGGSPAAKGQNAEEESGSPKRPRPRFPKKPKAIADA
eukprot:s4510_g6.t1